MKKRNILFCVLFVFVFLCIFHITADATEPKQIEDFVVMVHPRMQDGSLDIQYEITWKVAETEAPLTWVQIGTPNSHFDTEKAVSENIEKISQYDGNHVRIDFKKPYKAGERVTVKYLIHQNNMCMLYNKKCKFEIVPEGSTNGKIANLTIKWRADFVKKSNSQYQEGDYLVWSKNSKEQEEPLNANVQYDKTDFLTIKTIRRHEDVEWFGTWKVLLLMGAVIATMMVIVCVLWKIDKYYVHRGFYRNGRWHDEPSFYGKRMRSKLRLCAEWLP